PELGSGLLNGVSLTLGAKFGELWGPGVLVGDETISEGAGLDVAQHLLHVVLDAAVDDSRPGDVVAIFRGVGDRPALFGDATFIHEVDDELEFVKHFEVGNFRLISGLYERLKAV